MTYLIDVVVACTKDNVSFFLILVVVNRRFTHLWMMMSSSFFGGEGKHSHIQKLQSENVKILTSASIFADIGTKITVMENILHAFSLNKTEPEPLLSEVDWGAHDSNVFLGLVNFDYDVKSQDFFTQGIWGGLAVRTSSTTLRSLNHVEGKLAHPPDL